MTDVLLLVVLVALPALLVVGPLAVLGLGIAAVADLETSGLVRRDGPGQPAPRSDAKPAAAFGSVTTGPAARMPSSTPSA